VRITSIQKPENPFRSLAIYGTLSLNLGLMALGGYYLGSLLEKNWHWENAAIYGVLTGFFLGLFEMFLLLLRMGPEK
jgi:hypothetical protein